MSHYANRVVMTVTGTPGTGTVTLNAATSGFQTFGAAFAANATVDVFITDGAAWEVARNCTYTHSGTTLTRGTREASSTGAALSLTSAAVVTLTLTAAQITDYEGLWASLGGDTISVTTTATATIGRMHVCTGTSADYTVTLPAATGNAGRFIGVRMAPGLTRRVTIDGNASETIDGALTRVMWAEESALLSCDGAGWFKVAGKSRPMIAAMFINYVQTPISVTTWTTVLINTAALNNTGAMIDAANNRILILRTGHYLVRPLVMFADITTDINRCIVRVIKNGTPGDLLQCEGNAMTGSGPAITASGLSSFVAGDNVQQQGYYGNSTGLSFYGDADSGSTSLHVTELPGW